MGASGSNNFTIQFGEHCRYCFAIKCPKGTLNFRPFSWIVSSVELWPLCTLYRQFSWEPFTMPVSWTKVKVWKQEGISSSAPAGSLLHRCKVCECSLASDCGSKEGTGFFDWSFLLCWDVAFGNRLGVSFLLVAEDSGCVVLFRWNEKVGGGWAGSPCRAVEDFVNTTFMVCSDMRLVWHLAAFLCLGPADTEGLVVSTFPGMWLSWGLVASLFLGPVNTENLVASPCWGVNQSLKTWLLIWLVH